MDPCMVPSHERLLLPEQCQIDKQSVRRCGCVCGGRCSGPSSDASTVSTTDETVGYLTSTDG